MVTSVWGSGKQRVLLRLEAGNLHSPTPSHPSLILGLKIFRDIRVWDQVFE